mmetsp:Transcript_40910/g.117183  ORF Transcript_40910/g.117183 Transcript_40910/m.117183 type:complete len:282 (-) Transcript_40910:942-1787(-)
MAAVLLPFWSSRSSFSHSFHCSCFSSFSSSKPSIKLMSSLKTSYSWPARMFSAVALCDALTLRADRPKSRNCTSGCTCASFSARLLRWRSPCTRPLSHMRCSPLTIASAILRVAASGAGLRPNRAPFRHVSLSTLESVWVMGSMWMLQMLPPGTALGPKRLMGFAARPASAKSQKILYSPSAKSSSMTFTTTPVFSSKKTTPLYPLPRSRVAPAGASQDSGDSEAMARTGSKPCSSMMSRASRAMRSSDTGLPLQAPRKRSRVRTPSGIRTSSSLPLARSR